MTRLALAALTVIATALPRAAPAQAPGKTQITWYGHAAFVVKTPQGTVLAIDPWFTNPSAKEKGLQPPEKLDFILVTHGHSDHVGEAIALGKATGAKLVAPNELANQLVMAGYPMEIQKLTPTAGNIGGTFTLTDEVSVTVVPAVHSSGYRKDPQAPIEYAGNPVGYIVHIKNGPRLYHTGDTAPFSDIQYPTQRWPIDVMMACIGGHFTMDPIAAARHVSWVNPKQVIPMHFGTFPVLKGTPAELDAGLRTLKVKARMTEMKVGETRAF